MVSLREYCGEQNPCQSTLDSPIVCHCPLNLDIMICAGKRTGAPKDACQGDSGGPLLDKNEVQVGVISFGLGCARYVE